MALLAYTRLVISGKIGSTQTWSTGIGLSTTNLSANPDTDLVALLAAAKPLVAAFSSSAAGRLWSVDTTITKLNANYYISGATKASAVAELVLNPVLADGSAGAKLPPDVALVVTTHTGTPGRSGRGRAYLPANNMTLTDHQMDPADAQIIANNYSNMLTGLNNYKPLSFVVAVIGLKGNLAVTSVAVDTLPDIQRRREDKIGALGRGTALLGVVN